MKGTARGESLLEVVCIGARVVLEVLEGGWWEVMV
jgi:hypothetical protein